MRTTVQPIYHQTNSNNNTSNGYYNNGTPYKSTTTTTHTTTSNLANNFHSNGMYTSNGINSNDITKNGVHRNGIHSNGVYTNGIHSNGNINNHITDNENTVKLRDNLDEEDDELSNYYLTNSTSNLIDDELYEINNNHINDGNNINNDKYSNTNAERVKREMEEQSKSRRDFMKRYESIDNITINETQSDVDLFDRYIDNDRLSVNSFLSETADYYKPFNTRVNNRLTTATSSSSPRSRSSKLEVFLGYHIKIFVRKFRRNSIWNSNTKWFIV